MNSDKGREGRRFTYKGRDFEFDPDTLRFKALGRTNANHAKYHSGSGESSALEPPSGGVNFVTLNIAHDCNMACPYCFAKQGLYGGTERSLMNESTACRAIDWLFEQAGEKQEVFLRFLGGEPFLNVSVMRHAALYAEQSARDRGKQLFLSVNTNGTIFNQDIARLIKQHRMTVSISMDGTRDAHNTFRVFRSGKGTYDTVVRNLERFLACDPYTMVNATLTAENLDVNEYAALFRSLGVRLIRFAMVGTAIPGIALAEEERLLQVLASYDRLAETFRRDLLRGEVWYLADFYKYFDGLRTLTKRHNRCGAGVSYVNIDVRGNVNLCHRFTTDATQRVGHIDRAEVLVPLGIRRRSQLGETAASVPSGAEVSKLTGTPSARALAGLSEAAVARDRRLPVHVHRQLDGRPFFEQAESTAGRVAANVCARCDIRYLCGGSCFHDGEILYGDLFGGPDGFKCEVDRHLAKIAMWIFDAVFERDPSLLGRLDSLHLRSQQHHAD